MTGSTAGVASLPSGNLPVPQSESSQEPSILSTVGSLASSAAHGVAFNYGGAILGKAGELGSFVKANAGSAISTCRDAVASTAATVWPRVEPYTGMMVSGMVTGAGAAEKFLSYNNPQVVKNLCSTLVSYAAPVAVAGGKVVGKLPFAGPMIVKVGGKMALTAATYPHLVALLGVAGAGIYLYNRYTKKPEPDMKPFEDSTISKELKKFCGDNEEFAHGVLNIAKEFRRFDLESGRFDLEEPLSLEKLSNGCAMALAVAIMVKVQQERKSATLCFDLKTYAILQPHLEALAKANSVRLNKDVQKPEKVRHLSEWYLTQKQTLQEKSPGLDELLAREAIRSTGLLAFEAGRMQKLMRERQEAEQEEDPKVSPSQVVKVDHQDQAKK